MPSAAGVLTKLTDERAKLLHAHYAGAVPLDLLKTEQERISREIGQAEQALGAATIWFEEIEATIREALDLVGDCAETYRKATPLVRRQFNQAFFNKILIDGQEVTGRS
jgi:site-specific DNA recombinase